MKIGQNLTRKSLVASDLAWYAWFQNCAGFGAVPVNNSAPPPHSKCANKKTASVRKKISSTGLSGDPPTG